MAEINRALKAESQHSESSAGHLDLSPEAHEKLSGFERRMLAHAKDVLWRADFERRDAQPDRSYTNLTKLQIETEMDAHGIQISSDRTKVRYDPSRLLNPVGCPLAASFRTHDTRNWQDIAQEARQKESERVEAVLSRNRERNAERAAEEPPF